MDIRQTAPLLEPTWAEAEKEVLAAENKEGDREEEGEDSTSTPISTCPKRNLEQQGGMSTVNTLGTFGSADGKE